MGWEQLPPEKDVWPCVCTNCQKLTERIKVLEDALNLYVSKFGNCGWVYDTAIKALEVKP